MKRILVIIGVLLAVSLNSSAQTRYVSKNYNYSFIIPDGWHSKEKIMNPDVDAKIVDGKGSSFVVAVKTFPTSSDLTATQMMEGIINRELEEQFNAVFGETKILKRGTVYFSSKEFYYIHFLTPFTGNLKLYHKQFLYNEGYKILSIDACAVETNVDETSPAFSIMLSTLEFSNLKNK